MNRCYECFIFLFSVFFSSAQGKGENILLNILHEHPKQFDSVLQNSKRYRLQIIYTQIDRDDKNRPHLTTYCVDTNATYFYCASMVKLLEIPLAIEKINNIKKKLGVTVYDSMVVSGDPCGDPNETNYKSYRATLCTPAQMIKEMLLVSNNHAFNPLYDFLGQAYFNKRAHELGYTSATICSRFANCDSFQNRITSSVLFYDKGTGHLKYIQPATINPGEPKVRNMNTVVGRGFLNADGIGPPKDFAFNNYVSLLDLHRVLISLIFPNIQPKSRKLNLKAVDYAFIKKYLGMFPRESLSPKYQFPDNKVKFYLALKDTNAHAPDHIRIFNKVGEAYGFTTDCSYIEDTLNKVEFFISATIYTNKDEILNDDIYEYESIALPFFRNLFTAVYDYELNRGRKRSPVFEPRDFTDQLN